MDARVDLPVNFMIVGWIVNIGVLAVQYQIDWVGAVGKISLTRGYVIHYEIESVCNLQVARTDSFENRKFLISVRQFSWMLQPPK